MALCTTGEPARISLQQPSNPGVLREDLLLKIRAGSLVSPEVLLRELRQRRDLHAERLAIYQDLQERHFPDPQHLSYEQRCLYLPLLRGLLFETENIAWCDTAMRLLAEGSIIDENSGC